MKNKTNGKCLHALLAGAAIFAGMGLMATTASATTLTGSVGGVPSGADAYENFNNVPLGGGTFTTDSGIVISFGNDGSAVQGAAPSLYAPPFLSGGNGLNFATQPDGSDTTTYLTSGSTSANPGANVTLTFAEPTRYMGLLWGSVDAFNTLAFFNGVTQVGHFTGADVTSLANGDQGASGTYYVNINLSDSFTSVVATSSSYAFEFDNVAISAAPLQVPEPGSMGVFLLGLLLVGSAYQLKRRRRA